MILRILLLVPVLVAAAWDCKVDYDGKQYDLSPLKDVRTIESSFDTPPTVTKNVCTLSLCSPLPSQGSGSVDECPDGTLLCLKTFTTREGVDDRIISVIPVAGDIGKGPMSVTATDGRAADGAEFVLNLDGGEYAGTKQHVELRMKCDGSASSNHNLSLVDYDGRQGKLVLDWQTRYACPPEKRQDPPPSNDDGDERRGNQGMGFFGWLFTLLLLGLLAYFALGYYNNWSNYGATGWDAVPHRDLWRELPSVIGDLFRGRGSSRSGYNSLG